MAATQEAQTLRCANHPARETLVRCGKCEKPLCPDCMFMTPVGVRCRECANLRPLPTYDVPPALLVRVGLVGLVVACVLAFLIWNTPVRAFGVFLMPFYGWLTAEAIARLANEKRGPRLQLVAAAVLMIGVLVAALWPLVADPRLVAAGLAPRLLVQVASLEFLIGLAFALVFGITRLR